MPERTSSSVSPSAPLSGYSLPRYSSNARRIRCSTVPASSGPALRIATRVSASRSVPIGPELATVSCRGEPHAITEREAERLRRGEAAALGDPVDRLGGRLDQLLGAHDSLMQKPRFRGRSRDFAKAPQEIALAHRRAVGQTPHADWFRKALASPLHQRLESAPALFADRRRDELLLPAFPVRGHDEPARHSIRDRGAEIAPDQVKPGVDAGGAPRRRDDLAFIHI